MAGLVLYQACLRAHTAARPRGSFDLRIARPSRCDQELRVFG